MSGHARDNNTLKYRPTSLVLVCACLCGCTARVKDNVDTVCGSFPRSYSVMKYTVGEPRLSGALISADDGLLVPPEYGLRWLFQSGLAVLSLRVDRRGDSKGPYREWACIESTGKVKFIADANYVGQSSEGLFIVLKNGRTGYLDTKGRLRGGLSFEDGRAFSEGLAAAKSHGRWGFIGRRGQWVITPRFIDALSFSCGLAGVADRRENGAVAWGFVDRDGRWAIERVYEEVDGFSENRAAVKTDGRWGYIDPDGELVIDAVYVACEGFSHGLAAVKREDELWGFIDGAGKCVIDFRYAGASRFSEGLALVSVRLPEPGALKEATACGYIDLAGNAAVPFKYRAGTQFRHGVAIVENWNPELCLVESTIIDQGGRSVMMFRGEPGVLWQDD